MASHKSEVNPNKTQKASHHDVVIGYTQTRRTETRGTGMLEVGQAVALGVLPSDTVEAAA